MANKLRGDVDLKIGDRNYTLCFDHNALIELEDQLDRGVVAISAELTRWSTEPDRIRLKWIRALLFAGVKKHQPKLTLDDVTAIMDEAGQTPDIMTAIAEAMAAAFGSADTKVSESRPTNGDAQNGIGTAPSPSTSHTDTLLPASGNSHPAS